MPQRPQPPSDFDIYPFTASGCPKGLLVGVCERGTQKEPQFDDASWKFVTVIYPDFDTTT
jgi:hypothetical protein